MPENPHAGNGPVLLDIGGDIGALVVTMPAFMREVEVEIVPSGSRRRHPHDHHDGSYHLHHEHEHGADAGHQHPPGAPPHVAVVARPTPGGTIVHSLVFGELVTGSYDLYVRPDGPVQLTANVVGGQVTETHWPATPAPG